MMFFNRRVNKRKESWPKNILAAVPSESGYAESFRTLRTNLFFSVLDKGLKSISITSALQSEGKTNTAVSLGYTIAKTGKKVLLVDADLRRPFLTDIFELKGKAGFTDLVVDTLDQPIAQGGLEEYSVGDLIQLVKFQNLTGTLNVYSEENEVTFQFVNGTSVDVEWNNRPASSTLLNSLVEEDALSRDEATTVLNLQEKTGRRIRTLLISLGLVTKKELEQRLVPYAVEAVRIASTIVNKTVKFLKMPKQSLEMSVTPALDFDILYKDFFGQPEDLSYINKSMDSIVHVSDTENLFILGAGKIPPNPSEIISSERTSMIIDLLKQKFDFIIFDTSPVLPASDAMLMAPRTDGTMLVVRSGYANKKQVKRVTDQFEQSNLPILGVVLNRADEREQDYYYQYYKDDE